MNYQAEAHDSPHSGHLPRGAEDRRFAEQRAWTLAYAAARAMGSFDLAHPHRFHLDDDGRLQPLAPETSGGDILWEPRHGWQSRGAQDAAADVLDLYLPISSASSQHPITVAHLGQSLDGFIATPTGESTFVTGPENILHLHRLRALCDAVVVGAGTVSADNPRLTTRLVTGTNPVRIVLDPACRLSSDLTVFNDQQAHTLRVCAAGKAAANPGAHEGLLEVSMDGTKLNLSELMQALRKRGYHRILVEGGGVTVSSFLDAGLVDRLHIAVAPVLIGEGRPAVRLPSQERLQDCLRLHYRVYRSGEDVLFDCDLRAPSETR